MEEIMIKTFNRLGMGLSASTAHRVRRVLISAIRYAVDEKWLAENPVSKTKLPAIEQSIASTMSVEEAKAFVSMREKVWYGYAFAFQLHTGLRPQELLALIWEDIDFEQGTVRIERACQWVRAHFIGFGPPKTKRSNRTIKLAPEYLGLLRVHYERQLEVMEKRKREGKSYGEPKLRDWIIKKRPKQAHLYANARLIFPSSHGDVAMNTGPRKSLKIMLRHSGITVNYRWYDLRHTHATLLLTENEPIHEVAARMGHSVTMLLTFYAHFLPSRSDSAPTLLAKLIPI
jgi:integrase